MFANFVSHHIISFLIFFPILGALILFCLPRRPKNEFWLKTLATSIVSLEFLSSLYLIVYFVSSSHDFQFASISYWLSLPGVHYTVGIDGLSLYLVLLVTFISLIVLLSTYSTIQSQLHTFLACFLILEGSLIGAFVSLDLFLFYFFWEISLIPLYFMIGIWGGEQRIYATLKFFIYGVIGSVLMLVAFVYLYCATGRLSSNYSSNFIDIYNTAHTLPYVVQCWLFTAITLAFAIKIPIFPLYTWLVDTYEQSPAIYTMMSGVVLKLAAYGLIRLSVCLFPVVAERHANFLLLLGVINILYGALIAWQQTNLRRIMAFSSLSHMGFIVIGIFAFNTIALQGALYQMINHAITATAFFILFQFLESKFNTLNINELGGLASIYPWFGFFFGIVAMSAVGLPSTGSFLGEWLILFGVFKSQPVFASIATLGLIFGAVYVLWFTYKVIFGPQNKTSAFHSNSEHSTKYCLPKITFFQLSVLCVTIFILGFASNQLFELSKKTFVHMQDTFVHKTAYQAQLTNFEDGVIVHILH